MRLVLAALVPLFLTAVVSAQPAPDDRSTWNQTAQGVRLLGGSASLTRQGNSTSGIASPRIGWFVADGLALGATVQLGYARSSVRSFGNDFSVGSLQLGVGPSVTYYFGGGAGAVRPFAEASAALSYRRLYADTPFDLGETTDTGVSSSLAAGVEIPIARNVALRTQAFYTTFDFEFTDDASAYGLSAGFSTFIY